MSCNINSEIIVNGNCNLSCPSGFTVQNGGILRVTNNSTFTINGDATFNNGSIVTVDAGSTLIISGSLLNKNNSNGITIDGFLYVNGDVTNGQGGGGNSTAIGGSGSISASGTITGPGNYFGGSYTCTTSPCTTGISPCSIDNRITSTSSPVCSGAIPPAIMATEVAGATYFWEIRPASATSFSAAPGTNNAQNYTPIQAITETTYYRRSVTRNGCTNNMAMTSYSLSSSSSVTAGSIEIDQTICTGTAPLSITSKTSPTNYSSLQWQISLNNSTWTNITGATGSTYAPGILTATTYFRRNAISTCGGTTTVASNTVTITVNQVTTGSASTTTPTRCSGTSASLSLSGHTGTIQWQRSNDNGTTWANVSNADGTNATSATLTTVTLVNNTSANITVLYRAMVTATNGCSVPSNQVSITVTPVISSNTLTAPDPSSVCAGTSVGQITGSTPTGGTGSYTYEWQSSINNSTWSTITTATGQHYTPGTINITTYYRRIVASGNCNINTSASLMITATTAITNNNISTPTTGFCGSANITITGSSTTTSPALSGGTGTYTYQWQSSADGNNWSNITNATGITYSTGTITTTTHYRRNVTSGLCSNTSNQLTITITPAVSNNTLTAPEPSSVCAGTSVGQITGSYPTGGTGNYTYQWQSSADGSTGWTNIAGATGQSYIPGAVNATTYYRRVVISENCSNLSIPIAITLVQPAINNNSISSTASSTCSSASATINGSSPTTSPALTGGTGTYTYQWQSSSDGNTWSNIANATGVNYTTGTLNTSTHFRRMLTSGMCSAFSNVIILGPLNNTITPPATSSFCASGNVGQIVGSTPSGGTAHGNTFYYRYEWESSANNSTWAPIANTNSKDHTPGTVTQTTYFRRKVENTNNNGSIIYCTSYSNTIAITINVLPPAPTVTGTTICSGQTATLTPSAGGATYRWYNAASGGTLLHTGTLFITPALTASITYHVSSVSAANCESSTRTAVTVTVDPATIAGSIAGAATVCSGTNSTTLTLSGHTGNVVRWESSTNNFNTVTTIANTTTSLNVTNLTATTQYRAVVKSGVCSEATTTAVTITVDPATVAGTLSGAATVCSGTNSTTLTLAGHRGSIIRWESSTNNFVAVTTIANSATSLTAINLTTTTQYRAVVKSGTCPEIYSNVVTVTVNASGTWLGTTSNDWFTASNWCGGVPTMATNVLIPSNAPLMPIIGGNSAEANHIQMASGASFTITDGTLQVYGNFHNDGSFAAGTNSRVVMAGAQAQAISGQGLNFGVLEIDKTGFYAMLNNPISVSNTLILKNGSIQISNYDLTLSTEATIEGASATSYVVTNGGGLVRRLINDSHKNKELLFPIGDIDNYTPLRFTLTRASLSGSEAIRANVKLNETMHNKLDDSKAQDRSNPLYLKRVWTLEPEGPGLINQTPGIDFAYNIIVNYRNTDISIPSRETELVLGKYSSGSWMAGGGSIDTTHNLLSATGISSFSEYTAAEFPLFNANQPLPITLLYFNARPAGEEIELTWATAMEENNDFFTVERSLDGKNYHPVLEKKGAGHSNQRISYKAYDRYPAYGLSYYRLKQTDYDGTFAYSAAVAVNFNGGKTIELVAYPNPGNGHSVNVIIRGLINQKASAKVVDLMGKVIYTQNVDITENSQEVRINFASKLTSGTYTILINSNKTVLSKKLLVN